MHHISVTWPSFSFVQLIFSKTIHSHNMIEQANLIDFMLCGQHTASKFVCNTQANFVSCLNIVCFVFLFGMSEFQSNFLNVFFLSKFTMKLSCVEHTASIQLGVNYWIWNHYMRLLLLLMYIIKASCQVISNMTSLIGKSSTLIIPFIAFVVFFSHFAVI